jgi:exopolysaccharide biosynthesis polyprenyl glycosylphosphotransferase
VGTVLSNPRSQSPTEVDWSRLIPGGAVPLPKSVRTPSVSVRPFAVRSQPISPAMGAEPHEHRLRFVVPRPLFGRAGLKWLRSVTADWAAVALSWLAVVSVLTGIQILYPKAHRFADTDPAACVGFAILQAALITLLGYSEGLYTEQVAANRQARILAKSVAWTTAVLCFAYGLQGAAWFIASLFFITALLDFGGLYGWRLWSSRRDGNSKENRTSRNVLIVGAARTGCRIASYVKHHPETRRIVCGFLDDAGPVGDDILGRTSDLARLARKKFIDEIILTAPQDSDTTRRVLEDARRLCLDVQIVPELFGCEPVDTEIERVGGIPVICIHAESLPAAGLVLKRVMDVLGAAAVLALLAPALAVIAALIKLESPGPILYSAKRAGRKGKSFRCYKFRTMVANADELKEHLRRTNERSGPFFKVRNDPRVTRIGKILRRYSLDELPQLWNVVKGDMSLVGPRPHPLDDVAGYEVEHLGRLDVTPGITGLWQVTARRDPSFRRGLELDREYIRTWSLSLDFMILLRTFRAVLCGSGD